MKILNCIFLWCVGITLTPLPTPRPAFNSLKVTWMLCTKPAKVFRKNILRKIFSAKILCTPKIASGKNKIHYSIHEYFEVPLQNGQKIWLWAFGSSLVTSRPNSGREKKMKKTRETRENFAISAPWCTNDLIFCVWSSFLNTKLFC